MKNQRILITGASRGLESVVAVAFAKRGARVVLLARSEDLLESVRLSCQDPERHLSNPVDLLKMEDIQSSVLKAKGFLCGNDLVLQAVGGGLGFKDDLLKPEEFSKLFALNLGVAAEINRLGCHTSHIQ